MAEAWVEGDEYTIPILGDTVLPMIKLETKRDFYDYQAKYEDDDTKYICPCGLDGNVEKELGELALQACNTLGVSGWSRVDVMIDKEKKAWLIEVNTIPGMTSHSLVPMAAKQVGISFEELAVQILATSLVISTEKGLHN
jgi:D-alanine-D-alanine ligase